MSDTHDHGTHNPPGPATPPATASTPQPGIVNVIFRGAFVFIGRPQMIEILVPNLGPDHVYRAGTFLGEVALPPASLATPYMLEGVEKTGTGRFPTSNMIFSGYDYDHGAPPDRVHCRLVMPRPFAIHSFRPVDNPLVATRDPLGLVNGKSPNGFHVFHYNAGDINAVHFHSKAHTPRPHTIPGEPQPFVNLHLVAEPEIALGKDLDRAHVVHAFDAALWLLPALRGTITLGANDTAFSPHTSPPLPGVCAEELESLKEAGKRLVDHGHVLRRSTPRNTLNMVGRPPDSCLAFICE